MKKMPRSKTSTSSMEERTKTSLEKLKAKVEAHKPKDMPGAKALAEEIAGIFTLLKSKVQKADTDFRLKQSQISREMHDHPDKEEELFKQLAESQEQKDILHYQELQKAFKDWIHNRLEDAKAKVRAKSEHVKKLNKKYGQDDDF